MSVTLRYDALVIGSGIAGLSFVLALSQQRPNTRIALLCKKTLSESNSFYAQGGIAAVSLPQDSLSSHLLDTLASGDGLSDPDVAKEVIEQGPSTIEFLRACGVEFDQARHFPLGHEGGHSQRRIYTHGDRVGSGIIKVLIKAVKQLSNVTLYENHTAVNLITAGQKPVPGEAQTVIGAYVLEEQSGVINTFLANVVILATGGAGKVYSYTSNPEVATGDGIAMAYRAGARVSNLEFYQFHPTLLYHTEQNNVLISEALRGEGAFLRLVDSKKRFMQTYAPLKLELATRDIVARAIFTEIERSSYPYVYLDITHRSKEFLQQHFPDTFRYLLTLGIDMSTDFIPVVPGAHYLCGGIVAGVDGVTDLNRLFAIGEVACTGLHGANRLASNSLLEGVVMGRKAAKACEHWLKQSLPMEWQAPIWNAQGAIDLRRASQINAHWRGLRGEMSSYAGIVRTAAGLKDLLRLILMRRDMIEEYYWKYTLTRDLIELRNILLLAELIVRSALQRRETRGGHYREDFPGKQAMAENTVFSGQLTPDFAL